MKPCKNRKEIEAFNGSVYTIQGDCPHCGYECLILLKATAKIVEKIKLEFLRTRAGILGDLLPSSS